ncbi:MAG TPA: DUF2652 domain-containing protein [Anaerolineae bacterium]|nr:DUF2652 domain-containing protein [Anaerolineae bacterium]
MEIKRVVLVLADISGYTRFMKIHTTALIHAEAIITDLLEAVLNQAEVPLTLSKLEGDAAFLYAVLDDDRPAASAAQDVLRQVTSFFEAFRAKERELIACDVCRCDACNNIGQLKLKAFLHVGEAAFKKIRQFEELAGEDVILIHRLLKNTIPAKEYILLTDQFYALSGGIGDSPLEARTEEAEGLGAVGVHVYYPARDAAPLPPRPAPALPTPNHTDIYPLAKRFNDYAVKRTQGQVEPPQFNHLPNVKFNRLNLLGYMAGAASNNIAAIMRDRLQKS